MIYRLMFEDDISDDFRGAEVSLHNVPIAKKKKLNTANTTPPNTTPPNATSPNATTNPAPAPLVVLAKTKTS